MEERYTHIHTHIYIYMHTYLFARNSLICRLNCQLRGIKEAALYRCARIVSGPRSVPCLRRHTEGPRGARGPGQRESGRLRRGAFSVVGAPRRSPPLSVSHPRRLGLSLSVFPRSPVGVSFPFFLAPLPLLLSRARVIYRAANSNVCFLSYFVPLFLNNVSPRLYKNKAPLLFVHFAHVSSISITCVTRKGTNINSFD